MLGEDVSVSVATSLLYMPLTRQSACVLTHEQLMRAVDVRAQHT